MHIVLVEDDHQQAELIERAIGVRFQGYQVERIKTESEFYLTLEHLLKAPPDLVIMDVMLRWASAAPKILEPPEEVRKGSFFRAGLRCQRLLASHDETRQVPVILYTVLEAGDFQDELASRPPGERPPIHLKKQSDVNPLINEIYRIGLRAEI